LIDSIPDHSEQYIELNRMQHNW